MVHAEKKNLSLDRMQPGKIQVLPGEDKRGNSYSEYFFQRMEVERIGWPILWIDIPLVHY